MKKLVHIILASLGTVLFLGVSQFSPVSALQEHSQMLMNDQGRSMSYEQHCSPFCISTEAKNEDLLREIHKKKKEDDEPQPPYYLQFTCPPLSSTIHHSSIPPSPEDPLGVPLYRLCGVVRR